MKEEKSQNLLTEKRFFELLNGYTQEILLPAMDERFVTKKEFNEFKNEMYEFKNEMYEFKNEMYKFKDEVLTGQDQILKKLDILLTEKTVRDYQKKKERKMWAIIIKALRKHNILSSEEMEEIAKLEIF